MKGMRRLAPTDPDRRHVWWSVVWLSGLAWAVVVVGVALLLVGIVDGADRALIRPGVGGLLMGLALMIAVVRSGNRRFKDLSGHPG